MEVILALIMIGIIVINTYQLYHISLKGLVNVVRSIKHDQKYTPNNMFVKYVMFVMSILMSLGIGVGIGSIVNLICGENILACLGVFGIVSAIISVIYDRVRQVNQ